MKPRTILAGLAVIAIIAILYYTMGSNASREQYASQITKEREDKDHYMQTSAESPFSGLSESFRTLNYFPPAEKYRVIATLRPIEERKVRTLATSDGKEQRYLEYAWAEFDLDDRKNRLLILEIMERGPDQGTLFLAFGDQTSAGETYGAGRYLDIKKMPGSPTVELDFNKAYNPYCAYNETYSCPLPPAENLLDVAIRAGEKNYKQ
jgi:hypothetical protein